MGLDIFTRSEIAAAILAAVVLTVRCAQQQGGDPRFVAGALTMAEHNAHALGVHWPGILDQARAALGGDVREVLDAALALEDGNDIRSE